MNTPVKLQSKCNEPVSMKKTNASVRAVKNLPVVRWLSHGGPKHPKHKGWIHPVAVFLVHYTTVFVTAIRAHDLMLDLYYTRSDFPRCLGESSKQEMQTIAATLFLIVYSVFVLSWRLLFHRQDPKRQQSWQPAWPILYEYCWLCNVTLWLGAWALYTARPILASALCVTVGIDQLLWYVDLAGVAFVGKFPVGVAKYLSWPQNANWSARITCSHHLWTIPLLLIVGRTGSLHPISYPLSFLCMTVNVLLSRWMTPLQIEWPQYDAKYLNVNLSHELWKDIKFQILQINYDDPPAALYLFRLLWRWQGFNTLVYAFLYALIWVIVGNTEARVC